MIENEYNLLYFTP